MPAAILKSSPLLRLALLGDAVASGATGLLLAVATRPVASLLGLPDPLLRGAALVLLPYVVTIAWAGLCSAPLRWVVQAAVLLNLLWAGGSIGLLISGPVSPTPLGVTFVLAQALVVLAFAVAQWIALRRAHAAAVAAPAFV